jgi:heptose II phosphotransferase
MKYFNYKEYRVLSNIDEDKAIFLLNSIFSKSYQTISEYNDNKNSFVSQIKIKDFDKIIFKIPRNRNSRWGERFLTFFRGSDSFRIIESLKKINDIGLNAPDPIFAAQKRRFGMVVDSFYAYNFIEGREAADDNLPEVLKSLQILHSKGYTRSDPKLTNFLIKDDQVYFIDFRLKRPAVFKKLFIMINLCKFLQAEQKAIGLIDDNLKDSILFKTAFLLNDIKSTYKKIRRNIKSKFCRTKG